MNIREGINSGRYRVTAEHHRHGGKEEDAAQTWCPTGEETPIAARRGLRILMRAETLGLKTSAVTVPAVHVPTDKCNTGEPPVEARNCLGAQALVGFQI